MADQTNRNPNLEWLDYIKPVGLVVAPSLLGELGLTPLQQTQVDSEAVRTQIGDDDSKSVLGNPWPFLKDVLRWETVNVAGAPGGPAVPEELSISLPEHGTVLSPTYAVAELGSDSVKWQLLVRVEAPGIDPDDRGVLDGWEATPQQRFERLLRDTGVYTGVLISERADRREGETVYYPSLRLVYAPRGETSGHLTFPLRALGTVAGRPMLAGLKLLLDRHRLFNDAENRRLSSLLKASRDAQAAVSTELAGQVLGALHELLRGLDSAEPVLIQNLAASKPDHLYEGLLSVLMRLVFTLYAEDRDLLPSRPGADAQRIYETSYSVRGLYAKLVEDVALNPDTMDERRGGWGRLLALFRLIYGGHRTSDFIQARGGKLFNPDEFPFLEGRQSVEEKPRVPAVSDGCVLRVLEGLMTLKRRGSERERLSYRALDVEQIGSVYETVMGFTVESAKGRVLAIKAGKNNRTPVFVELEELLTAKGKDRIKFLKEEAGRTLTASQSKPVETAKTVEDLAAALDSIVDERASPKKHIAVAGTPVLQPTGERRRTGSHYTPRSLTAPIVKYALQPSFERLGPDATPEQILDLKVCDPAMGSGAFLVEACRAIAERLVFAWEKHKDKRPVIPASEDEQLHARRLVAQRCLYGVDKNPRAVDLARLSLWLATLARDHEFTFLDHALKCGDSLVGLTRAQIERATWGDASSPPTLFSGIVRERVAEALKGRAEIRDAPDNVSRAIQEHRYAQIERGLQRARDIGDAVIAAYFSANKAKAREKKRAEVESWLQGGDRDVWDKLAAFASTLRLGAGDESSHCFHWELEFPEVFARENGGFDAVVGNPPFAGKNTIIAGSAKYYLPWLQTLHEGAHGNADLVAHFFRRAFGLLRRNGVLGLIATNTIGQGDTRASGLTRIIADGGAILRATRRLKWPGEAAVVVSVVHIVKGAAISPVLDKRSVRRISAYLVEGDLDVSPVGLAANSRKAFQGSIVLGMGFTFDDIAAAKGEAESLDAMRALIAKDPRNAERIVPYIGGEEVNNSPTQAHHRYVIDFFDRPLRREPGLQSWFLNEGTEACEKRRREWLRDGVVPIDYPDEVAEDWPDLIEIVRRRVKPERDAQKRDALRERWWQYAEKRPGLYRSIAPLDHVFALSRVTEHLGIAKLANPHVYADRLVIFSFEAGAVFALVQSRVHEAWARFFSATMEDRLLYAPSDCFRTYSFPSSFEADLVLEAAGQAYYAFRAQLMIARKEGLTKTYNRFHSRNENAADIVRLRILHHEMDVAVLRAYGWDDLAERAAPEFIEQEADEGKAPKTRLDWPTEFKDEVLSRLLALNAERAAEERAAGLVALAEDEDEVGEALDIEEE